MLFCCLLSLDAVLLLSLDAVLLFVTEQLVCTPSQYLASLHFSGKALLVPESVEESL